MNVRHCTPEDAVINPAYPWIEAMSSHYIGSGHEVSRVVHDQCQVFGHTWLVIGLHAAHIANGRDDADTMLRRLTNSGKRGVIWCKTLDGDSDYHQPAMRWQVVGDNLNCL